MFVVGDSWIQANLLELFRIVIISKNGVRIRENPFASQDTRDVRRLTQSGIVDGFWSDSAPE